MPQPIAGTPLSKSVTLGTFTFDRARGSLDGPAGPVPLRRKGFELLQYLVDRPRRLLSKQELLDAVWPDVIVGDDSLTQCVTEIRRALGPTNRDIIKTVPRRGYMLNLPDTNSGSAGLPLPSRPSVAVLPFTNLGGSANDYFSDGITEDIITELSRLGDLLVIARNSSYQYKDKAVDVRQIGHALGVKYVLQGSVRRESGRVRITVQLIDAVTRTHHWAERYDRELAEMFAVQEEVARTISTVLAAHVSRAEAERALSKAPATWEAYDFYLRAQDCYASFHRAMSVSTLYEVRRLLDQCLEFDQKYARAYALYSTTKTTTYSLALDQDQLSDNALADAHRLARKAVELDDRLPQAHAQLGYTLGFMRQHDLAVAEFERAFELNSNFTDWRFALTLVWAGDPARAVEISRAHMRLDPFCLPIAQGYLGLALFSLKKYGDALPVLRDFVSRAPKHTPGRMWLAATYARLGRLQEAQAEVGAALRLEPGSSIGKRRKLAAYKSPDDQQHFYDALRQAGLSE